MALTLEQQADMYQKVLEIYHHLGIDGKRPVSFESMQQIGEKKILAFRAKQLKRENERKTSA